VSQGPNGPVGPRVDPLSGRPSVIVTSRQDRPNQPNQPGRVASSGQPRSSTPTDDTDHCPFCPGGLEAPELYDVRCFPNRWPALPDERCEVVLYSPDHQASWASLSAAQAAAVVDRWAQRSQALGARPDVDYVLVFENRGAEAGATISHPHGQIYAYDQVPPAARLELERDDVEAGLGLDAPGERLVHRVDRWRSWVPAAAGWPYELVLAPETAEPDLASMDHASRAALGALLVDSVARLDRLFDAPMPFMSWIHQRPFDGGTWPRAWVHVHLCPLLRSPGTPRFVAAAELGGGILFNPVDPVDAADALRRA
jgi:UDPglucose--hexose-1-phosphate uridylyltransferase